MKPWYLTGVDAGLPALVVDAADQVGKLGRELGRLVDREAIAQRMEIGAQDLVGLAVVIGAQLPGDFVQPDVGLLDAALDDARLGHWATR